MAHRTRKARKGKAPRAIRIPKRARKHAGLSLADAVTASGVSKATICRIENGRPASHDHLESLQGVYRKRKVAADFSACPRA